MDATDVLQVMLEATLALTLAVLWVLAVRRPARQVIGARAAHVLWLAVPVALVAVLLPRGSGIPLAMPVEWAMPVQVGTPQPAAVEVFDWRPWLAGAWLAGVMAMGLLLTWQQRAFVRALGRLHRRDDGLYQAGRATAGLPAVTGLLRPRILLPADFEQRYSPRERQLVLEHERLHLRRGDLLANAAGAALRCLFWFHPLLPLAQRCFRHDQELACDAAVIARHPHGRRAYGEAMLKTQFNATPLPLGCHWQVHHPLKERIEMLKRPVPGAMRWLSTTLAALALSAGIGYAAWAAQPAQPAVATTADATADGVAYAVDVRLDVDGTSRQFQVREYAGRVFGLRSDGGASPAWEAELSLVPRDEPGQVLIGGKVSAGGVPVAEPKLVAALGRPATIQLSTADGRSIMTLELTARRLDDAPEAAIAPPRAQEASAATAAPATGNRDAQAIERMPPPRYPVEAAQQGAGAVITAIVTVEPDGTVSDVRIERPTQPAGAFDTDFEAAVVEAARKWKFSPALKDGRPVAGRVRVPVTFSATVEAPAPSPLTSAELAGYEWLRVPRGSASEAACDLVRADPADAAAPLYCGMRKQTAAR